jgi:hypothetical protein
MLQKKGRDQKNGAGRKADIADDKMTAAERRDCEIALRRMKDQNDPLISSDEMRRRLARKHE